jgi:hypothetical protein
MIEFLIFIKIEIFIVCKILSFSSKIFKHIFARYSKEIKNIFSNQQRYDGMLNINLNEEEN